MICVILTFPYCTTYSDPRGRKVSTSLPMGNPVPRLVVEMSHWRWAMHRRCDNQSSRAARARGPAWRRWHYTMAWIYAPSNRSRRQHHPAPCSAGCANAPSRRDQRPPRRSRSARRIAVAARRGRRPEYTGAKSARRWPSAILTTGARFCSESSWLGAQPPPILALFVFPAISGGSGPATRDTSLVSQNPREFGLSCTRNYSASSCPKQSFVISQ